MLRNGDQTALVAVRPDRAEPLFSPVAELRVLSGPVPTAWITDTDVGNASSLAAVALERQRDSSPRLRRAGQVRARPNFIWRPAPVQVRSLRSSPRTPKLLAMAEQVVAYDEVPVALGLEPRWMSRG